MDKMSPVYPSLSGWCTVCPSDFWIWLTVDRHEGPHGNALGEWPPLEGGGSKLQLPLLMGTYLLGEDIVLCQHQLRDGVF